MNTLTGDLIGFGGFRLDAAKKVLWNGEKVVSLPLKAIELLCVLVEYNGDVVSKDILMERVWGNSFVEDSVLTQNIYLLRKTFQKLDGKKNLIKNVPRRGYLFKTEITHPHETEIVLERHLFERIQIEEAFSNTANENLVLTRPLVSQRRPASVFILVSLAILFLAAVSAFFYFSFRSDNNTESAKQHSVFFPVKAVESSSANKSFVVLRFKSSDENLSSTFSSDLTSRVGSHNKFTVRPFAIVRKHEETAAGMKTDFVMDGIIEARNNRFQAKASIRDTKIDDEIWSQRFDDADMIRLQDAIANQAVQAILNHLTPEARELLSKRLPTNIPAYETYTNGFLIWRRREDGSAYLQKAIELDNSFATAYVTLANIKATSGVKDSPQAKEAEKLLQKAFELDEGLADAYAVQGLMLIFHQRDWQNAERSLKYALEMDPNCINAHHWLGVFYSIHRRLDEAKAEMQNALELDPTNPTLLADIGQLYYFSGNNGLAVEYCKRALAFDPNHLFANAYLAYFNQAPRFPGKELALSKLRHDVEQNVFTLPYINVDPAYDSLRDEPRFQEILRKMNLPD